MSIIWGDGGEVVFDKRWQGMFGGESANWACVSEKQQQIRYRVTLWRTNRDRLAG